MEIPADDAGDMMACTIDIVTTASKIHGAGSDKPGFSNTIIYNEGLWERLNLIFMYATLRTVSIRQIIMG